MNNKEKGDIGENMAAKALEEKGYEILERNYRSKYGEIDIISKKDGCIVFVEVKLRKSVKNGLPKEAVTLSKQRKIINTAGQYIFENNTGNFDYRFDVIEILDGKEKYFKHIENAFWIED